MTDRRDTVYLPFDRDEHLGPPPWKPDDPAVQAWEAGHGHDVRLKCYAEFGCQAIENALEAAEAERDALRDAIHHHRNAYEFRHIAVTDPMDAYHLQLWAHVDSNAAEALAALSADSRKQGT